MARPPRDGSLHHNRQDAPIHAAIRAYAMLETGDLDGYGVWRRMLRAVGELRGTEPKSGEAVH